MVSFFCRLTLHIGLWHQPQGMPQACRSRDQSCDDAQASIPAARRQLLEKCVDETAAQLTKYDHLAGRINGIRCLKGQLRDIQTDCRNDYIGCSSESWEPQTASTPWHSRARGGAVHSVKSGVFERTFRLLACDHNNEYMNRRHDRVRAPVYTNKRQANDPPVAWQITKCHAIVDALGNSGELMLSPDKSTIS